jgi:hypothetical protein
MTRSEQIQICDQCEKETRWSTSGGGYYGGHPLSGWLHLKEHGGSSSLDALSKKMDHDFCSAVCLKAFFENAIDQA